MFHELLRKFRLAQFSAKRAKKTCRRYRPQLLLLEDRWLPSTYTVTSTSDSGSGTLRNQIAAASNGDIVQIDSSLAGGTITITSGDFLVNKNIQILGPGGAGITVQRDTSSSAFGVFAVPAGSTVTISGMTIQNGVVPGWDGCGAGIYNGTTGTMTITNSTVTGNTINSLGTALLDPDGFGAGICNQGTLTASNTTISNNYIYSTPIKFTLISQNTIGYGGGICNYGTLTINNCIIQNNTIDYYPLQSGFMGYPGPAYAGTSFAHGGGFYNDATGSATLSQVVISGNHQQLPASSSTVGTGQGGGVYNKGTMSVSDSYITSNYVINNLSGTQSYTYGGGIYNTGSGSLTVSRTAVTSNSVSGRTQHGGGIFTDGTTATFTNDTIAQNKAWQGNTTAASEGVGGGVSIENGDVSFNFCTISENQSLSIPGAGFSGNSYGGGINVGNAISRLDSTLVAGNQSLEINPSISMSPVLSYDQDYSGTVYSSGYNLIGIKDNSTGWLSSDQQGTRSSPLNPKLGPLQNNGGPAIGYPSSTSVAPTYEVLYDSPALKAGQTATKPSTDQRGVARNQGQPNVGAYEAGVSQFLIALSGGGSTVTHGSAFSLIVTAADAYGKTVYTYTGTVHFSSTDTSAVLPSDYTFTTSDHGVHTFSGVVLNTVGTKTITLWDIGDSSKNGSKIFTVL